MSGRQPDGSPLLGCRSSGLIPLARIHVARSHMGSGPTDAAFDLVLASSTSFSPREIYRVLHSGGTLLTLQGGTERRSPDLVDALQGTPPEWTQPGQGWDIDDTLDDAGFVTVEKIEREGATTYRDIGAVVYFLKAAPWAILDFEVNRYRQRLYQLHLRMKVEGGFTTVGGHCLIEAHKPYL